MEALDEEGRTALLHACCNGHVACVEALLRAGSDVTAESAGGITSLIEAAASDSCRQAWDFACPLRKCWCLNAS